MNDIDYSIIIPVYYNEGSIEKTFNILHEKVISINKGLNCELIFIDDGSRDNSFNEISGLKEKYPDLIRVIKFTRNFGQVAAIYAGYQYARGKCLINISADLQDPPELINEMIDCHLKDKYEIVICTREAREDSYFQRKTSGIFYKLIRKLSFPDMPSGGFDFVLISDKVKDIILEKREANPFWQGHLLWTGHRTRFIPYKRSEREIGTSRWTFSKKIKYLIDGVTSYSYFPLRLMSVVGGLVALVGFLYAVFIIFARIFGDVVPFGWAPIMVVVLLLSGIQMLMLGIVGEYLWRVLDQVRNRQPYIIENIWY
ncbi:MAG: glycosyltransferase [Nitrospirae bacterium]|nr:glycosyltransferase [Nitrospirota bacterium]